MGRKLIVKIGHQNYAVDTYMGSPAIEVLAQMVPVKEVLGTFVPDPNEVKRDVEMIWVDPSRLNLEVDPADSEFVTNARDLLNKALTAKWAAEKTSSDLQKEVDQLKAEASTRNPD